MLSLHVARITRQRRRQRQRQSLTAPRLLRRIIAAMAVLVGIVIVAILAALGTFALVYAHYARELPPPENIIAAEQEAFLTTTLYDRTGQTVIYEVIDPTGGDRRWVRVDDIPQYFLDATVAIEDASFYENPGFDLRGMTRALWSDVTGGQLQGGSTITQQLVRNVLFSPQERAEISVDRKVKEVILATEISRLYSKKQILEWYV
ncbi:MAG TPA: biosynthetic peptidoglycan transglycosylase, partial [Aggregatilineaceae bacterium]|nr:biosynthetic peptidoglycan transglycosylase [Aggregatilineaceae bacterium]